MSGRRSRWERCATCAHWHDAGDGFGICAPASAIAWTYTPESGACGKWDGAEEADDEEDETE